MKKRKAILVVSFGTSYKETCEKNIEAIENEIRRANEDYEIRRAFTSGMIIRKLKNRDGIIIDTVAEAMERLETDGFKEVIVQPTHIINGIENDNMVEAVLKYKGKFESLKIGAPLLSYQEDYDQVIEALSKIYPNKGNSEAVIFTGHGSEHHTNAVYAALDYQFKSSGMEHVFVGTVEAFPNLDLVMKKIEVFHPERVVLAPFMIVAGDHAMNDMAADEEGSWYHTLKEAGYKVECDVKGLGEYDQIRRVFLRHVTEAKEV